MSPLCDRAGRDLRTLPAIWSTVTVIGMMQRDAAREFAGAAALTRGRGCGEPSSIVPYKFFGGSPSCPRPTS